MKLPISLAADSATLSGGVQRAEMCSIFHCSPIFGLELEKLSVNSLYQSYHNGYSSWNLERTVC